jgi:large subunit ribosomal protein L3
MAGRMGGERVTVKGLRVIDVIPADNLILIGGAVPGRRGTVIEIRG